MSYRLRSIRCFLGTIGLLWHGVSKPTQPDQAVQHDGAVGVLTLGRPDSVDSLAFATVSAARELRNGRVLVLDINRRTVRLVDFAKRTAIRVGLGVSASRDVSLPSALLGLPGDTTALVVFPTARELVLIAPTGQVVGTLHLPDSLASQGRLRLALTDSVGRFYAFAFEAVNTSGGPRGGAVVRWTRNPWRNERAALVSSVLMTTSGQAPMSRTIVPFAVTEQWTVLVDGRVAIVSPRPYRVTILDSSGGKEGPEIHTKPVELNESHRILWREHLGRPVPAVSHRNGGPVVAGLSQLPFEEPRIWPTTLLPFMIGAVFSGADGRIWVQRTTSNAELRVADVFDYSGRLINRVALPIGERIVAVGHTHVFTARRVDDGERLLRYRIPYSSKGRSVGQ
jgi:hypothetical protein